MLVGLSDAAWIVKRHPRVVQRRLLLPVGDPGKLPAQKDSKGAWLIDTEALARFYAIDAGRLAEIQETQRRSPAVMAAEMRALRVELEALRRRVDVLERARLASSASDVPRSAFSWQSDGAEHLADILEPDTSDSPLSASYGYVAVAVPSGQRFSNRAEAARWLVTHGVHSETTPKSWQGWRDVPLEPRTVLRDALARQEDAIRTGNHRVSWRLHPCDDSACICRELLS